MSSLALHFKAQGTGLPIVLTTGIGATSSTWAKLAPSLERSGRVLCWDLRGHGQSEKPDRSADYTLQSAESDLMRMIGEAGGGAEKPAILIGHSFGGYLTLRFAIRHPERARALVLLSTGPGFRDREARARWNRDALGLPLAEGTHPMARELAIQADEWVIENLSFLSLPVLVIAGEHDVRFLRSQRYLLRHLPNSMGAVIHGGRHSVHVTHAVEVSRAIEGFLTGLKNIV